MSKLTLESIKKIPEMTKTMTNSQIANELGICIDTVKRWLKRLKVNGYVLPKRHMGRPRKHAVLDKKEG